jgi:hypothetical protein
MPYALLQSCNTNDPVNFILVELYAWQFGLNIRPIDALLKSAFRGQPISANGKRIIPVNHPLESRLRVSFDRLVLGLEPAAVGRFWVDLRIRDQGRPPSSAPSPELALRVVAALPGRSHVCDQERSDTKLKVLTVDDKAAGELGYALKASP